MEWSLIKYSLIKNRIILCKYKVLLIIINIDYFQHLFYSMIVYIFRKFVVEFENIHKGKYRLN